ncbi:MAG: hypothetical protein K2Y40_08470 [Reyranella sp.]|jgi:hypothetical protein|nr:hypothetical protein [Reyranella sp.]
MKRNIHLLRALLAASFAVATVGPALAQGSQDKVGPGKMVQTGPSPGQAQDRKTDKEAGMKPKHCCAEKGEAGEKGDAAKKGDAGSLFGTRVTPMMNLSVEDVRSYLAGQIQRLNNKRLKVGEVKAEEATITAGIVTVDNSLVQRLKVDRHTGAIEYQD